MADPEKLRLREKISSASAILPPASTGNRSPTTCRFSYTDIFGLTALAASAMLRRQPHLDALFDIVIGMSPTDQQRWGKFRPYSSTPAFRWRSRRPDLYCARLHRRGRLIWAYATSTR